MQQALGQEDAKRVNDMFFLLGSRQRGCNSAKRMAVQASQRKSARKMTEYALQTSS